MLVAGVGTWAVLAQLSGAVVAVGSVKVDRNLKAIQHRDGGIVGEIAVREGDFVQRGEILLRIDDAQTRAELAIAESQVTELTARRARLVADRDGLPDLLFPEGFVASGPEAEAIAISEANLLRGIRTDRQSQKEQLELRIAQVGKEINGLEAQLGAKADELKLVTAENIKFRICIPRA